MMSGSNKSIHSLRFVFLGLLLLAVIGPWSYDRINVPAQYACSAPFIRLEGDFCGQPIAGFRIISMIVFFIPVMIANLFKGDPANMDVRSLFLMCVFLLSIVLPVLTTFLVVQREPQRRWQVYNLAAWGLAMGTGLFIGLSNGTALYANLWGIWLLIALAAGAMLLELITLVAGRNVPGNSAS